jgi:hypothetical protein
MEWQEISNEAKSRHVEGGTARKRKQSQIGEAIESFVEFKRSSLTQTLEALEENKKHGEDLSTKKCLDELDTTDGLTYEDISYAMDVFEYVVNRGVYVSHSVLEGKPNVNHVCARIKNSRTQRLHNWTSSHNARNK